LEALVLDCETTGATNDTNGSAFSPQNRLMLIGASNLDGYQRFVVEHGEGPYGDSIDAANRHVAGAGLLVGFNIKFDLHWLRRYGIDFTNHSLWDTQLVEFILNHQRWPDPSLGEVAVKYNLPRKLDRVRTEYWEMGLDTDQVPLPILSEYLEHDVFLTSEIYKRQREYLADKPQLRKLCWIHCQDLMVTEEMEWNGLKADFEQMQLGAEKLRSQIAKIDEELNEHVRDCPWFNWNSGEHLSALLYGGDVRGKQREEIDFNYKDGRVAKKLRWVDKSITLPRLVEPLKGTQLQKGHYQTNVPVLQQLRSYRAGREFKGLVDSLLQRAALEQRVSTYYEGWPKLAETMGWEDGVIHGNINHTRAGTTRLSSSRPNQQNKDKEFERCIITRF